MTKETMLREAAKYGAYSCEACKPLVDIMFGEQCSCVVRRGDEIRLFREPGVRDLYRLLHEEPEWLRGAFVADRVVGKGAAALMVLGGVRKIFADVISFPALELLNNSGIPVSYTLSVERIENRSRSGLCPVETRCMRCTTPEECLAEIEAFMAENTPPRKQA